MHKHVATKDLKKGVTAKCVNPLGLSKGTGLLGRKLRPHSKNASYFYRDEDDTPAKAEGLRTWKDFFKPEVLPI